MKKFIILLSFFGILILQGYTQPTALITVENPRIVGSNFYFDVYFERTNDDPEWYGTGFPYPAQAGLQNSSWWFNWNTAGLNNPAVVWDNATYFNSFYSWNAALNLGKLEVTQTITGVGPELPLNTMFHAFTVRCDIVSTVVNSQVSWDQLNTGLVGFGTFGSVIESYLTSDCDIALNTSCWTGTVSGDWDNSSNWSPAGIPSGTDMIYPNLTYPLGAFPISGMSISPYGDVQNLRVNHLAEMPIPQYCGITVSGDVTLKGGPRNIICQAGTGVSTPSSAFIPEGLIDYNGYSLESGHIEVHRTLYYTATDAGYYMHQVAAPVDGVILDDWDMIHFYSYAYEWDTQLQDWWNIYVPSRNTPPGYGFILSLYEQIAATTEDVVFYDNLVLTDVTPTFSIAADEYALLGNPYTAPIDWDVMNPQTNIYNSVWVWDPASGNYVAYVEGSGGNASAQNIQPGQSFFIQASGAATQFSITTGARVQNIQPYLKEQPTNLIKVYTEGGNETVDEVYIRFKEGEEVTAGFDPNHDADEWPSGYGEYATEIYTVGSDGRKLAIDARPMITDEQSSVPLSFKPAVEAEYKLHADEESLTTFAPSIKIMLEDKMMPEQDWVDMRAEGYYTFNAAPGDDLDRFVLHFYDTEFGIEDGGLAQPVRIYSDRTDAIIINDSEQLIREILVYDITGNLIKNKATVNSATSRIYVSDEVGYYIVKVITDKAVYSEKVLITK